MRPPSVGSKPISAKSAIARLRSAGKTCTSRFDDCSRVAYAELLPDESATSAVLFLEHALAWFAPLGVAVHAVMTDNAFCYVKRRFPARTAALGPRDLRTCPYTPRTNGEAERFIQTAVRAWA